MINYKFCKRTPDFIIIGSAKCATTTLAEYLNRLGNIRMSIPKEPEFFIKNSPTPSDVNKYCELFRDMPDAELCGEASTAYTRHPYGGEVAQRIASAIPNVKLIYIVREPIYRAYADCAMIQRFWYNTGRIKKFELSFEDALCSEDPLMKSILDTGRYYFQISQYLKYFPMSQIHILNMEDLINSPRESVLLAARFLGRSNENGDGIESNLALNRRVDFESRVRTAEVAKNLANIPLANIFRYLTTRSFRENAYKKLAKFGLFSSRTDCSLKPMREETFIRLKNYYKDDIHEFEQLTGLDCDNWRLFNYENYVSNC